MLKLMLPRGERAGADIPVIYPVLNRMTLPTGSPEGKLGSLDVDAYLAGDGRGVGYAKVAKMRVNLLRGYRAPGSVEATAVATIQRSSIEYCARTTILLSASSGSSNDTATPPFPVKRNATSVKRT